jgi:hypothetical protein
LTLFDNILALELIQEIPDFDTSTFIQLVFALPIPNTSFYTVLFASGLIHTIKMIANHFQEMSLSIS